MTYTNDCRDRVRGYFSTTVDSPHGRKIGQQRCKRYELAVPHVPTSFPRIRATHHYLDYCSGTLLTLLWQQIVPPLLLLQNRRSRPSLRTGFHSSFEMQGSLVRYLGTLSHRILFDTSRRLRRTRRKRM